MVMNELWREGLMAVGVWVPSTVIIAATPFGLGVAAGRAMICGGVSGFLLAFFGMFPLRTGGGFLEPDIPLGSVLGADVGAVLGVLTCAIKNLVEARSQR